MSEKLICAACKNSTMTWINPEMDDLLENGIMKCKKCGAEFKGMEEWHRQYMIGVTETNRHAFFKVRFYRDNKWHFGGKTEDKEIAENWYKNYLEVYEKAELYEHLVTENITKLKG